MSLKIRTEAHARRMKMISSGITFIGKYASVLKSTKRGEEASRLYILDQPLYPSFLALTKAVSASILRPSDLSVLPFMYQAIASFGIISITLS